MSSEIKRQRIRTGLTQEEAAKTIGIHPTTLNKYESGARIPSGKVLKSMGQLFKVTMDTLIDQPIDQEVGQLSLTAEEQMYKGKYLDLLEKYSTLQEKQTAVAEEMIELNKLLLSKKHGSLKKKHG